MKRRNGCFKRLLFFCLAAALALPLAAQSSMADYLVQPDGYWRLEETITDTTVVVDERGLTNGTCSDPACPASVAGQIGNGFSFDGVNDTVTFPGAGDDVFDFDGAVGFSIEMWIKRAATVTAQEAFIGRFTTGGAAWWVGLDDLGRATCDFWDADGPFVSTQFSGGTVIADDAWHHVVVVRDGVNDRMMIYVDGELDAISDQSGHTRTDGSFASTAAVTLGQLNNALRYRGALDNLAVYRTKALSAHEIRQLYLNGFNGRTLNETFAPIFVGSVDDTAAVGFNATWIAQAAANPLPSYASANLPRGAELDGATGEINWLPLDNQVGPNPFTVTATNAQGTANQSWAIEVEDLCASALDGYWKLDVLQPTTPAGTFLVLDELGVSDGTCTNCPTLVEGRVGNGLNFAEGDFTVSFPGAGDDVFDFDGTVGFSIEMWIKRAATVTAQEAFIGRFTSGGAAWWIGLDNLGRATCDFWDADGPFVSTQFSGGTVIADDAWHHVVVVRDGINDRMMIYVDGKLDAISDQSGHTRTDGSFASTAPVTLGQLNNALFFSGILDELAVYNTALSPTIIAQHYNAAAGQYYCSTAAPTITSTAVTTASEGVAYTYQAAATISGGLPLVWSLLTAPAGMAISDTGLVTWTPGSDADEQTAVEIQVAAFGATDTQAYTIEVALIPVNTPPVITTTAPTAATVGVLYTYEAEATDDDGDTLTWSLSNQPAGMTVNAATGVVTWTPPAGSEGDVDYTLTVSDGQDTDSEMVTVTVSAAAPVPAPSSSSSGCFINTLGF